MNLKLSLSLLTIVFTAACSDDQPAANPAGTHTHADGGTHQDHPPGPPRDQAHAHGERVALGDVKVGEHTISVFQLSKVEPGKEGDFDLVVPAGKILPGTVRGWIGVESAKGSIKVRFEKETAVQMHGHPEVPNPIPEGSKLWLEVEGPSGASRAAVSFQP